MAGVDLHGICKRFGDRVILDRIDLTIAPGEFFALVGPSGSGKSTLLKTISGIEPPDAGQVFLGGQEVTRLPPYRRRVHTVFQNYALFPHLDVSGNVGFPLRVAGLPRAQKQAKIAQALGWVQLEHLASRRIEGLSGGERQRVAVARALVDEPECVLLDEPLSALDPHLRGQTLQLLQEIQARLQITYVYVTHDREEALRAAHRLAVLNQGRLEQVGTPEEVYHRPRTAFVASFAGPINWLSGALTQAEARPSVCLRSGEQVPLDGPAATGGGGVRLGIRPEDVRLGDEGFLAARVIQRQFAGGSVVVRLATADGTDLLAEVRSDTQVPAVGDRVRLSWAPRAAHLFPDPDAGTPDRGTTRS